MRQDAGTKLTYLVSAVLDLEVADNAYVCFVWSATSFESGLVGGKVFC